MLSKKSEHFLVELRMYLISKGKNDAEMISVIEELEDHLLQAEADGKSVETIVGNSPKAYMKSIGESMPLDLRQLAGLIPMAIILIAAYITLPYAIWGDFALSPAILFFIFIGSFLGLGMFGLFMFKAAPKLFHSKWKFYLIYFLTYSFVTGGMILAFLWWNKQEFEPTFVATPFQNILIIIACIAIFILSAIYMKTWINIIAPTFIAFLSVTSHFVLNGNIKESTFIAIYVGLFLLTAIIYFIFRKSKKNIAAN